MKIYEVASFVECNLHDEAWVFVSLCHKEGQSIKRLSCQMIRFMSTH